MPRWYREELWSNFQAAGGTRKDFIPDVVSVQTVRDVTGDESHTVAIKQDSRVIGSIVERDVLRAVRRDATGAETFDEWRIAQETRTSGVDSAPFTFVARAPLLDLANAPIFSVDVNGVTLRTFTVAGMTPAQVIDTYVLPAAAAVGLSYFARGTVDATTPIDSLTIEWSNALELLQQLASLTRLELRTRANGTSGFFIDLTTIGAGAAMPTIRARKNLLGTSLLRVTDDLVTRCIPRGDRLPAGSESHSIARIILQVTAVAGSTIAVADPNGVIQPIGKDDEFNGWCVFRPKTGGTFDIVDTIKATQQFVLTSASTIVVGEYLELRSSDPRNLKVGIPGIAQLSPLAIALPYVSAVNGGDPTLLTVANALTVEPPSLAASPKPWINFDDQFVDHIATLLARTFFDTNATITGGTITFSTAAPVGTAVGDFIVTFFGSTTGVPPFGTSASGVLWEILTINGARTIVTVQPHYTNRAEVLTSPGGGQFVAIYKAGASQRVVHSFAATQQLKLAANPSAAVNNLILIDQVCSGVLPSYLDDPVAIQSPPTGFGIIARVLQQDGGRGEGNVIPNGRLAAWSNPSAEPDGYQASAATIAGGLAAEFSQNANPAFVQYGVNGKSWAVTFYDSLRAKGTAIRSPLFYLQPVGYSGLSIAAFKISLYVAAAQGDVALAVDLCSFWDPVNIKKRILLIGSSGTVGQNETVAGGGFYDFTVAGIDLKTMLVAGPNNFEMRSMSGGYYLKLYPVTTGAGSGIPLFSAYLDALAMYQVDYDPGKGVYVTGSYANQLLDAGNVQLAANAQPTKSYTLKFLDLERIPNTPWSEDAVTLGGQIDFRDPDLALVDTPRVSRMEIDELAPDNTQLVLATQKPRITTILAGSTA